jgi:deferrochelatase/peroxidase EfeB
LQVCADDPLTVAHTVRMLTRTPGSFLGLLFAAYQADADRAFVPVQRRLQGKDALNRWITHVGSAVFALPPGCAEGGVVGREAAHSLRGRRR